jgi:hypothetical protein
VPSGQTKAMNIGISEMSVAVLTLSGRKRLLGQARGHGTRAVTFERSEAIVTPF